MTVETKIYSRLSSVTALTDLVGDRIYPNIKAQDVPLPAISYRRVSAVRFSAMGVDSGVVKARYQVDVWSTTPDEAWAIRELVRQTLQRWSDKTTGTEITDTFIITETDLFEGDTRQHHIAIDVEINYIET